MEQQRYAEEGQRVLDVESSVDDLMGDGEEVPEFLGYREVTWRKILYVVLCVGSLGAVYLTCRWVPRWYVALTCNASSLDDANRVCVKGREKELTEVIDVAEPAIRRLGCTKVFTWRFIDWRLHEDTKTDHRCGRYRPVRYPTRVPFSELASQASSPAGRRDVRLQLFGSNLIHVPVPNPVNLLLNEVLHPFYLFQAFSVLLWFIEEYWVYAIAIVIISVISAVTEVWQTRNNMLDIKRLAEFVCPVIRLDSGVRKKVSSKALVPGDLVEVSKDLVLPCDMVLLSGKCVFNEAMLTGECVPIVKSAVPADEHEVLYDSKSPGHSKHTLFAGTRCIQAKPFESDQVLAMVTNTGFSTAKGGLVRSILYPKPLNFKFYRDSFYFIGFLFLLTSASFLVTVYRFVQLEVDTFDIIIRALDLYTIAIPPALPIALTIGVVFAVDRLKKQRIHCIAPSRVNLAGLVEVFCFDKTGTLTTEGLEVMCVREGAHSPLGSSEFLPEQPMVNSCGAELLRVLVTCHGLAVVEQTLVGDSLELKMFEATDWALEEVEHGGDDAARGVSSIARNKSDDFLLDGSAHEGGHSRYGIVKRFDFSSELQRMSTVAMDMDTKEMFAVTKGAPEVIGDLAAPSSLPPDYHSVMEGYSRNGFRVLACASHSLGHISVEEAKALTREAVEEGSSFSGLLVMQNKLKPETTGAMKKLQHAQIDVVMITGDNPLTACYVAKECGLIPDKPVFICDVGQDGRMGWRDLAGGNEYYDSLSQLLVSLPTEPRKGRSLQHGDSKSNQQKSGRTLLEPNVELAVTGPAFRLLAKDEQEFDEVLSLARVFARMKPDQKQQLVEAFVEKGHTVGMCGDGANDCNALKAADVGLSLSEAEASIAAPFTSAVQHIGSTVTLLREGRCALVTSFQAFKFMAMYSLIQFFSCIILYLMDAIYGDMEYLYVDLFVILPLAFGMSRTGAYEKLSRRRPISSLMSPAVICSLLVQIGLCIAFQAAAVAVLYTQDGFVKMSDQDSFSVQQDNTEFAEVTAVFLIANFQYVASVFAFSVSRPFRKPFYTNPWFTVLLVYALTVNCYLLLFPSDWVLNLFEMVSLPTNVRWMIFGLAVLDFILTYALEWLQVYLFLEKGFGPCGKQSGKATL